MPDVLLAIPPKTMDVGAQILSDRLAVALGMIVNTVDKMESQPLYEAALKVS